MSVYLPDTTIDVAQINPSQTFSYSPLKQQLYPISDVKLPPYPVQISRKEQQNKKQNEQLKRRRSSSLTL